MADLHERIERREGHRRDVVREDDCELYELYPDALPCLERLREAGVRVGVAANQPRRSEAWLRGRLGPDVLVATSAAWGVEKPSPAFFARLLELAGEPADRVAYVGDRVDNDVLPAAAAGMRTVFVERGPWAAVQASWPDAERADARVSDLEAAAEAVLAL